MAIEDAALFRALMNYFTNLENRRWNYFAVLVVVDGLMLNAWNGLRAGPQSSDKALLILLCLSSLLVFVAVLRLLNRIRRRVYLILGRINSLAGAEIISEAGRGNPHWGGVTIWLYFSSILLACPWFVALWTLIGWIALFPLAAFALFLILGVDWKAPSAAQTEADADA